MADRDPEIILPSKDGLLSRLGDRWARLFDPQAPATANLPTPFRARDIRTDGLSPLVVPPAPPPIAAGHPVFSGGQAFASATGETKVPPGPATALTGHEPAPTHRPARAIVTGAPDPQLIRKPAESASALAEKRRIAQATHRDQLGVDAVGRRLASNRRNATRAAVRAERLQDPAHLRFDDTTAFRLSDDRFHAFADTLPAHMNPPHSPAIHDIAATAENAHGESRLNRMRLRMVTLFAPLTPPRHVRDAAISPYRMEPLTAPAPLHRHILAHDIPTILRAGAVEEPHLPFQESSITARVLPHSRPKGWRNPLDIANAGIGAIESMRVGALRLFTGPETHIHPAEEQLSLSLPQGVLKPRSAAEDLIVVEAQENIFEKLTQGAKHSGKTLWVMGSVVASVAAVGGYLALRPRKQESFQQRAQERLPNATADTAR